MSSSKTTTDFADVADELRAFVRELQNGGSATVAAEPLSRAVGDLAKLYFACQEASGRAPAISPDDVSGTEAVALIAGLMEAQSLNTFDLALWLSRAQHSEKL
ncbi:MAG: hypothetical protein ACRC20_03975 [Segniliparus sp.]|uniref:hypothetical protein n=1 Tax=Segniliparus sp. TaxID=2804064 RepID=UPI003F35906A